MPVQTAPLGLEEQAGVDGFLNFSSRFLERLANFPGFEGHKGILVFHQETAHVADDLTSGWGRRGGPSRESSVSGVQGIANILSGRKRELTQAIYEVSRVGGTEGSPSLASVN